MFNTQKKTKYDGHEIITQKLVDSKKYVFRQINIT